ncbi:MAG TPA: VTT domain-containing protein [Myxococcaceae bacterium]|nr:VTT domain-containing protein [Myxococcaceae bacterium]
MNPSRWMRIAAPVLASIAGLAMLRLLGPDLLDQETLRRWLAPLGGWTPVAFVALLALRPLTLLPGQPFTALGGILFGALPATVYGLLGSLLSAAVVFALSRRFGTRFMRRFAGENFEALQLTTRRHDFKLAAVVTLNPLLPTDMMIALAGASGARFWPTALGTLVGTVPGTWITAQFGSALGTGRTILTVVSAGGMLMSMALGVWIGRRFLTEFDAEAKAHRERRHRRFPHLRRPATEGP